MLIVYPLAIFVVAIEFHSYSPFQKIVILAILIFAFLYIVFFRLPLILRDVKQIIFPPKSIFIDGDDIGVWKLVQSLKEYLGKRDWTVLSDENGADFKVILGITKGKYGILCQIEDAQGRKETTELPDIYWPNSALAFIQEFAEKTHR